MRSISYDEVFKLAALRPDQLRDLTDVALKIANRLLLARDLKDEPFASLPREDAEKMMKALAALSGREQAVSKGPARERNGDHKPPGEAGWPFRPAASASSELLPAGVPMPKSGKKLARLWNRGSRMSGGVLYFYRTYTA